MPTHRDDEEVLTRAIVTLASQYGRYGYRRIAALLRRAGWAVGKDRVERIWRREGLKVPMRQKPRGRLWLTDGSCVRLRPQRVNHVWSYDFVSTRTHDGRTVRLLTLIDEHTRECLALRVARRLGSLDVLDTVADVMLRRGIPTHLRSDYGLPQKSRRQSFSDLTTGSVDFAARRQAVSTVAESHANHSHTGSSKRTACPHKA